MVDETVGYPGLDKQNQGDDVTGGTSAGEPRDGTATGSGDVDDFQARLDALNKL